MPEEEEYVNIGKVARWFIHQSMGKKEGTLGHTLVKAVESLKVSEVSLFIELLDMVAKGKLSVALGKVGVRL